MTLGGYFFILKPLQAWCVLHIWSVSFCLLNQSIYLGFKDPFSKPALCNCVEDDPAPLSSSFHHRLLQIQLKCTALKDAQGADWTGTVPVWVLHQLIRLTCLTACDSPSLLTAVLYEQIYSASSSHCNFSFGWSGGLQGWEGVETEFTGNISLSLSSTITHLLWRIICSKNDIRDVCSTDPFLTICWFCWFSWFCWCC